MDEKQSIVAFVHICAEPNRVGEIVSSLCACSHVTRVFSVTGEYDVIAMVRVRDINELHRFLRMRVMNLAGVKGVETSIVLEERQADGEAVKPPASK
ncbi:MAG: Lrp/AsnC ligand binding domain-containing protein [Candidatus Caldarchaeales archaeon]